jgi:hypothetical protein
MKTVSNREANRIVRERINLKISIERAKSALEGARETLSQARGRVAFQKKTLEQLKQLLKETK